MYCVATCQGATVDVATSRCAYGSVMQDVTSYNIDTILPIPDHGEAIFTEIHH